MGVEFSRIELQQIHFTLKFILQTASPQTRNVLVAAFKTVEKSGLNMHWFLCNYWEAIVPILAKYPYWSARRPSLEYELN
ncbi:hypothetical protein GO730_03030 [Spirosoma sp. HMF3257]|uniref:Uncharacterized protein n=1 Tax=Spirosoma telluris TaxID=2183553 RepID=A0A327NE99_9BACT|nr:hypothetical protein [Spirosoma telluris]RAI73641.1 hypothetical protein HMF3257_02955 [Spirosoma telluris]